MLNSLTGATSQMEYLLKNPNTYTPSGFIPDTVEKGDTVRS